MENAEWWYLTIDEDDSVTLLIFLMNTSTHQSHKVEDLNEGDDQHHSHTSQIDPLYHLHPIELRLRLRSFIFINKDNPSIRHILHQLHLLIDDCRVLCGDVQHRHNKCSYHDAQQHHTVEAMEGLLAQQYEETTVEQCQCNSRFEYENQHIIYDLII